MPTIPTNHIDDALKLQADGKVHLFELSPITGGTIYFKSDNEVDWRGHTYESVPCQLNGEEMSLDKTPTPRLTIGQEDVDLLPFKGLIHDGNLDGALLVRKKVLLDDLLNNLNIYEMTVFRVKRPENYSSSKISLVLATFSSATNQTLPFRQYIPPAFPWVDL